MHQLSPIPNHATTLPHCRTHLYALANIEQARAALAYWRERFDRVQLAELLTDIASTKPSCCAAAPYARELVMAAARELGPTAAFETVFETVTCPSCQRQHGGRDCDRASCGHPRNADGECDCSWWPERAPLHG